MAIQRKKVGISLPPEILKEIDELAVQNSTGRSQIIVRIFQQWKMLPLLIEDPQVQQAARILAGLDEPEPCAA